MRSWISIVVLLGSAATPALAGDMGATSSGRVSISAMLPPQVTITTPRVEAASLDASVCLRGQEGQFSATLQTGDGEPSKLIPTSTPDLHCAAIPSNADGQFTMLVTPE